MKIIVNKSPVDQFTLVHLGSGVVSHKLGFGFWATLAGGFVWDYALEPELKRSFPGQFPYPSQDAPTHKLIDAIAPAIGWYAYDWLLKRKQAREKAQ